MKAAALPASTLILLFFLTGPVGAATIWDGPTISFTDPAGSDPTLAVNQDRITSNDWITRGSEQGIYNAALEGSFTHFSSPLDTEWANGIADDYASLTFTDWNDWAKGVNAGPPSTVGVQAVMYLVAEDTYLNVDFTSWGGNGGGFSYDRSTPTPTPEPGTLALLGAGCTGLLAVAWRKGWLNRKKVQL